MISSNAYNALDYGNSVSIRVDAPEEFRRTGGGTVRGFRKVNREDDTAPLCLVETMSGDIVVVPIAYLEKKQD